MTGGRGSGYELFRDHKFRELWSANLALNLGLAMLMLGVAWEMTSLTDNPVLVAMVQTVMSLPFVFFSIPVGLASDARGHRSLLLGSQFWMLAVTVLMAVIALSGGWDFTPLLVLSTMFLVGVGIVVQQSAWKPSARTGAEGQTRRRHLLQLPEQQNLPDRWADPGRLPHGSGRRRGRAVHQGAVAHSDDRGVAPAAQRSTGRRHRFHCNAFGQTITSRGLGRLAAIAAIVWADNPLLGADGPVCWCTGAAATGGQGEHSNGCDRIRRTACGAGGGIHVWGVFDAAAAASFPAQRDHPPLQ